MSAWRGRYLEVGRWLGEIVEADRAAGALSQCASSRSSSWRPNVATASKSNNYHVPDKTPDPTPCRESGLPATRRDAIGPNRRRVFAALFADTGGRAGAVFLVAADDARATVASRASMSTGLVR